MEFPEPSIALLLLGSCGPGKRGDDEMSLSGININKKQMNLRAGGGGQLSINQGTRPLMANTAQVGWGETFSWPPPALISPPLPPFLAQVFLQVVLEQIPGWKGAQSWVQETRPASRHHL